MFKLIRQLVRPYRGTLLIIWTSQRSMPIPPRPSRATIRYRSTRRVPGEKAPLQGGCEVMGTGAGMAAFRSGSKVGASRMLMARPHEEQKWTLPEDTAPQPEQLTIGRIVSYRRSRAGDSSVE